ncbi:ricin-type beta-trefoil lectin domain protein [Solihabitans fulvus]|nr:ricin-type beta-trefoil lectin domain protein [Solihabitans fulvus]
MRLSRKLFVTALVVSVADVFASAGVASADTPAEVIAVSPSDPAAAVIAKAANVVPSPRQLAWQRQEQTAFIHFGVNTYDGREWGTGSEDPNIFQPTGLNTDQWAGTLRDAGFREAILTAKHHDGFLLFPSAYSQQSVAASSWEGGRGDVVRSFTDSAHKVGLRTGIYLSPADLHEALPGGRYANGSTPKSVTIPADPTEIAGGHTFDFTSDDYNAYYENTLYELLTRYGEIDEIWLDGANPTGRSQPYDFQNWITMVRALQPHAVIFNDGGPDVRWVGNENSAARQSEWSVLPYTGDPATAADSVLSVPGGNGAADLGGNDVLGRRAPDGTSAWNLLRWAPAECDATLSAHHNWFWQPGDAWRSTADLENLYYSSVGRNCNLLLDVPPNRQGVFDQSTVDSLVALHTSLSSTFGANLALGARAANDQGTTNTADNTPDRAGDGSLDTYWQPAATTGGLVLALPAVRTFDTISVQEDLRVGQRVESFAVDAWSNGAWTQIANDTTIGEKKLIRLPSSVTTTSVRLRVTGSRAAPAIAELGLYSRLSSQQPAGAITGYVGKCVDVRAAGTANGTPVQLYDCNQTAAQRWTAQSDGTIRNQGKCLDVAGGGTVNGIPVQLFDCNGTGAQAWRPQSNGTLVNPQSGRCLDDPAFATANGTRLQIWDCNGGANQKWTLPA